MPFTPNSPPFASQIRPKLMPAEFDRTQIALQDVTATAEAAVPRGQQVINVTDAPYGALVNGDPAATTTAIQSALNAGATAGIRVIASGTFNTNGTITFTTAADFADATFNYTGTGVAVQVGNPAGTVDRVTFRLPSVINANKTVTGWAQVAGTTGVRLSNLSTCQVFIPRVKNFEVGMLAHALAHGTQYCNFYPGHLENNKVNIKIAPEATGWVNQNNWIGGRPSHQSAEGSTPVTGCAHIVIAANANVVNSNVFYSTTLESIGTVEYHLDCAGTFNSFINCRWENSAGSALRKVMWRATSASNSIVGGISSDLITYVTEPGADNPGTAVKLNSFATSNLPPIGTGGMVIDSTLQRPVWSPNGVDIKTIATLDDIELQLTGVGIPEGVVTATPGSLYTRTDGGQRVNLCKRPISSTVAASTGWAAAGGTISVGSGYLRNTLSIATGTRAIVTSPLNSNAVLPGHTYSFSIQGRSNNPAVTFWTLVKVYDASFTQLDLKTAAAVSLDTTNFTTLPTVVYTMPANAAWAYIALYYSAGTSTIGDTLDLRRVMYEETPYPGPYIDGDLSNAGGVTYGWTGAANASTSTGDTQSAPVSFVKTGSGNTGWKPIVNATSISVAAAATDPATTQALVNGIRASLITAGILS